MTNWQEVRLDDICKINTETYSLDENLKYVNYLDTGNITSNRIENIQHIDLYVDKLPSRARRKVKNGNIIYSTVRPNQLHYGLIKEQPDNFLVSTGFAVLDIDTTKAIPEYVYYSLTQTIHTEALQAIAEQSTSAYPSIKSSDIGNRIIPLPPLDVQKKIAGVLGALDDKIELNNRINNNLEQQAQALFKSWFVDKTNPNRKNIKVEEFFNISIGKTPPRKEPEWFSKNPDDIIWVSISDMGNCGTFISNSSEYLTKKAVSKFNIKIVPDNTVLLSFKLTVGRVAITDGNMTTNEAIAHFITGKKEINEYLYCYLKNFNFQTMGSTSSIATAVNSKIIKAMPIVMPTEKELIDFHTVTYPMFLQIKANQQENTRLSALRDTLLPKLMSGEIDVSKVDINELNAADMLL